MSMQRTIIVNTQDGDFLGYLETDAPEHVIQNIIDKSFEDEENLYNYDITSLRDDIRNEGFEADRVFLEEYEL